MIIKNCPAYYEELCLDDADIGYYGREADYLFDKGCKCKEVDNCIIKRMLVRCNEAIKPIRQWEENGVAYFEYGKDKAIAKEILEMLEIEG